MSLSRTARELSVERGPDCLFVRLTDCQPPRAPEPRLAEVLWAILEQHFVYRLVLELDGVPALNDYLLTELATLGARLHHHGGMLRLCGLSPADRRVVEQVCRDGELPSYPSRMAAVVNRDQH